MTEMPLSPAPGSPRRSEAETGSTPASASASPEAPGPAATGPIGQLRLIAADIKLSHSIFALPFALWAAFLAPAIDGRLPGAVALALVVVCMVLARTFAMTVNRWADAGLDASNPRTAGRALPSGRLRPAAMLGAAAAGSLGLIAAAAGFWLLEANPWPLLLSPLVLAWLALYSFTKRFTWACHLVLGVTIGAAAAGGWIAVSGAFAPGAWWLWLAVAAWVAGFDVIYALLDLDFDRAHGIRSVPARFGAVAARWTAFAAHVVAWLAFAGAALVTAQGPPGWLGLVLVAILFAFQHRLVATRGPAEALRAFDANLWVGLVVLASVTLDLAWRANG